jgi:hypothetical protein
LFFLSVSFVTDESSVAAAALLFHSTCSFKFLFHSPFFPPLLFPRSADVLYAVQDSLQRINHALAASYPPPPAAPLPLAYAHPLAGYNAAAAVGSLPLASLPRSPAPVQPYFAPPPRWREEGDVARNLLGSHAEWMRGFQSDLDRFKRLLHPTAGAAGSRVGAAQGRR